MNVFYRKQSCSACAWGGALCTNPCVLYSIAPFSISLELKWLKTMELQQSNLRCALADLYRWAKFGWDFDAAVSAVTLSTLRSTHDAS